MELFSLFMTLFLLILSGISFSLFMRMRKLNKKLTREVKDMVDFNSVYTDID